MRAYTYAYNVRTETTTFTAHFSKNPLYYYPSLHPCILMLNQKAKATTTKPEFKPTTHYIYTVHITQYRFHHARLSATFTYLHRLISSSTAKTANECTGFFRVYINPPPSGPRFMHSSTGPLLRGRRGPRREPGVLKWFRGEEWSLPAPLFSGGQCLYRS